MGCPVEVSFVVTWHPAYSLLCYFFVRGKRVFVLQVEQEANREGIRSSEKAIVSGDENLATAFCGLNSVSGR